jgi:hypothetical protein
MSEFRAVLRISRLLSERGHVDVNSLIKEYDKLKAALVEIKTFPRRRFPADIANEALGNK